MKKKIIIAFTVLLAVISCSCGKLPPLTEPVNSNNSQQMVTEPKTEIKTTEPETEPVTQPQEEEQALKPLTKTCKYDGKLYFSTNTPSAVSVNDKFTAFPDSVKNNIGYFTIVDDYIYYLEKEMGSSYENHSISRCKLDGSGNEVLISDAGGAENSVFTDGKRIYYVAGLVTKCYDINSKNVTENKFSFLNAAAYKNCLLYIGKDNKINCVNTNTNENNVISDKVKQIIGINGMFVFAINNDGWVCQYELNGNSNKKIFLFSDISETAVSDGKLYYTKKGDTTIHFCDIENNFSGAEIIPNPSVSSIHNLEVNDGVITFLAEVPATQFSAADKAPNNLYSYDAIAYCMDNDGKLTELAKTYVAQW